MVTALRLNDPGAVKLIETFSLDYPNTGILKTVDAWAGSFYIEKKTEYIVNEAWLLFKKETNF